MSNNLEETMQFCLNLSDPQQIIPNVERIKISLFLGQRVRQQWAGNGPKCSCGFYFLLFIMFL